MASERSRAPRPRLSRRSTRGRAHMNLPPSIEAGFEELVDARDMDSTLEFMKCLRALLSEACRLQREADINAGWIAWGYKDDCRQTQLVVPSTDWLLALLKDSA